MIRNYLKTAGRNLMQNRSTSAISMAGLAVGICCFLLLATYLINELRYDRFHAKADRIVRMTFSYQSADDKEPRNTAQTQTAPVPLFKQQFSEIENGIRIFNYSGDRGAAVQYGDKLFSEKNMLAADDGFFNIFSFKFISGNAANALADPSSIVISASTAKKYFGDEDPVGRIMKVNQKDLMVTGVIEDVPSYSQIKFDMIANSAVSSRAKDLRWDSANNYSYLLLKPGVTPKNLAAKLNAYFNNLFKNENRSGAKAWYTLEPLTDVHLRSTAQNGLEQSGNIKYIYILGSVAVILLLLACVNFLNLVTARSAERAREIGVRKVMGARRSQLFFQFITEAGIITLLSLGIGVLLLKLSFPAFANFTGQSIGFQTWDTTWLISALAAMFVVVTLLAGTYPSLYLSAFKPIVTLKGKASAQPGGNLVRKSLVVFQFVVSVFFIICTLIAGTQLKYIQEMNTGINRDQVLVLDVAGTSYKKIEAFKNDLMQQPGVLGATASYDSPVDVGGGYTINSADGKNADFALSVTAIPIEKSFIKTMGIRIIAGEDLNVGDEQQVMSENAEARKYGFVLNEMAVKAIGWTPQQAIGKHIGLNGRMGTIKAVTSNFNFASLHEAITPIVMFPEYDWFGKLLVKTSGKNTSNIIAAVQTRWKSFSPNSPFEYHFLDDEFDKMYKTDQRTSDILKVFTFVTIFISCLGLFGLAVFTTRQRVKEIGIRKVLGAGVMSIVGLISIDFLKLVIIAIIISSPLAWYAMHEWLQDFAFRITIQWWMFALAGTMAALIAFLTVSYQSVKAALSNPVKSLRSE